jgi:hypothetical protein
LKTPVEGSGRTDKSVSMVLNVRCQDAEMTSSPTAELGSPRDSAAHSNNTFRGNLRFLLKNDIPTQRQNNKPGAG